MHTSDEQVIAQVQQGDAGAFGEFFHRHYPGIRNYLLHTLQPGDDPDDLAVEVFVRAYRGIARFRPQSDGSLVAYLYTIARNLARDAGRRRSARGRGGAEMPLSESLDKEAALSSRIEEGLIHDETLSRIRSALGLIPDEDREIIVLSYQQELSAREIMTVLGKPSQSAVRSHLYRALRRLRSIVRQDPYFAESPVLAMGGECDGR